MPLWPAFIRRKSLQGIPLTQCKNLDDTMWKKDPLAIAAPHARASASDGLAMAMAQPSKLEPDVAVTQEARRKGIASSARGSGTAQWETLRNKLKPPSLSCSLALTSPP